MKVEVESLMALMVSVDVEQHLPRTNLRSELRSCVKVEVAVLGSLVPNSPYCLCERKATSKKKKL